MSAVERVKTVIQRLKASRLGQFFAKYGRDKADDHAALIAFSALFSIFPLIGALLALLGLIVRDEATLNQLVETISRLFPAQLTDLLSFLNETRQITGALGIVSLVGLLWSGSALFGSIAKACNTFYGVEDRGFLGQRLLSFVMIFVFLGLIVVSVTASGLATFLIGFTAERSPIPLPNVGLVYSLAGWAASLGSAFLLFLAIYRVVPNGPQKIGDVWPGALLAAILFVLINQLFPLYLRFFGGGFTAYKTLGLFLLLMTWFYFLARILVLGCELNAFLHPVPASARVKRGKDSASETQGVDDGRKVGRRSVAERVLTGARRRLADVAILAGLTVLFLQKLRRKE